jgi:hypothetical protein
MLFPLAAVDLPSLLASLIHLGLERTGLADRFLKLTELQRERGI